MVLYNYYYYGVFLVVVACERLSDFGATTTTMAFVCSYSCTTTIPIEDDEEGKVSQPKDI